MIVGRGEKRVKSDLDSGAYHTEGCDATELGILDLDGLALAVPANHSAGARDDDLHSCLKIGAAADDVLGLSVTDIDLANSEHIGVGVGVDLEDLSDDDLVKALGEILRALYLDGRHSEIVCEAGELHILGERYEVLYPIK